MEQATTNLEVWGGLECTINRVDESYFDQLEYSGHYRRDSDIEKIAALGIKKIRYPILWEKHQQDSGTAIDWRFTEKNIVALRDNGIDIIAGLVHHGSGPTYVNMLDDSFADGLADYAGQVAQAFPWINFYTPVNEPLTTARFCGLYGVWYPHKHDNNSFCRILINECKATVLAMQAIRKVNPAAKLVQTDDLGKIHSTPLLQYQADFENNRRWLSFDLLCGAVNEHHPLWGYLQWSGIAETELRFFLDNVCTPDLLGINHYLTSERYIDENVDAFPPHTHGGNFEHRYADVEAVRVGNVQPAGPYNLLMEAWERYRLPIAVTEVHLYCTREEQMRWLHSVWDAACKLKQAGVDIRAITPWAMLGSYGWNRLLTQPNGQYEAGVFDLSSGQPRSTALAGMIKAYTAGNGFTHPIIKQNGWWQRAGRVIYGSEQHFTADYKDTGNPLLIIGKSGKLGTAFAHLCHQRGIHCEVLGRQDADITDISQTEMLIAKMQPWAIINAAGFTDIDAAEHDSASCFAINTAGAENLAVLCEKYGIKLLTYSTGLVFNGMKTDPYTELDKKSPLNVYGQSKAMAEQSVLTLNPSALVVRSSAFFSPWDKNNFIKLAVSSLQEGRNFYAAHDVFVSPTYVPDLVNVSLDLLLDDEKGIWHLSNDGKISWAELAFTVAERCGFNRELVKPKPLTHFRYKARRPLYSVLSSNRGSILPNLDSAINHFINHNL